MARKKRGLPEGFTLDMEKPDESSKPIRRGDYLDEIDARPLPVAVTVPPAPEETEPDPELKTEQAQPETKAVTSASAVKRTRLNVSHEARDRLSKVVANMKQFGPEDDIRASEVLEAAILSLYEAREHLDLSNVRRRGKWGSATHRMFPIALAESISKAIATAFDQKL